MHMMIHISSPDMQFLTSIKKLFIYYKHIFDKKWQIILTRHKYLFPLVHVKQFVFATGLKKGSGASEGSALTCKPNVSWALVYIKNMYIKY